MPQNTLRVLSSCHNIYTCTITTINRYDCIVHGPLSQSVPGRVVGQDGRRPTGRRGGNHVCGGRSRGRGGQRFKGATYICGTNPWDIWSASLSDVYIPNLIYSHLKPGSTCRCTFFLRPRRISATLNPRVTGWLVPYVKIFIGYVNYATSLPGLSQVFGCFVNRTWASVSHLPYLVSWASSYFPNATFCGGLHLDVGILRWSTMVQIW